MTSRYREWKPLELVSLKHDAWQLDAWLRALPSTLLPCSQPRGNPMTVGSYVKFQNGGHGDSFRIGRVTATEQYTDDNGTRTFIYVRWFCPDGAPDKETVRFAPQELQPAEKP